MAKKALALYQDGIWHTRQKHACNLACCGMGSSFIVIIKSCYKKKQGVDGFVS